MTNPKISTTPTTQTAATTPTIHLNPHVTASAEAPREAPTSYGQLLAEARALPADEVGRITAYVPAVVSIAVGTWAKLEPLLEQMRRELPYFDHAGLAKLPDYARALQHAYLLTLPSDEGETHLQALLAEATPLRERLLVVAEGLALFGQVDRKRVASIRSGSGRLDTANDLMALEQLFAAGGDELLAKTPLTGAEVERAGELGWQLVGALGKRRAGADGDGDASEADETCARLYRLLVRTYDQARRAVGYLRWSEGDASELVPSLFARRRVARGPAPEAPAGGEGDESSEPGGSTSAPGESGGSTDAGE